MVRFSAPDLLSNHPDAAHGRHRAQVDVPHGHGQV
jgi:hypothetical protein